MTKLQRGIVGIAMICLGLGLAASLAFAQDDGTQVTAAIPCAYTADSMTTEFARCKTPTAPESPLTVQNIQLADEPLPPIGNPAMTGLIFSGTVATTETVQAVAGDNSCLVGIPRMFNRYGHNSRQPGPVTELATHFVTNPSIGLECNFTIVIFHSGGLQSIFWSVRDPHPNTCRKLSETSGLCTGSLTGGERIDFYIATTLSTDVTYPTNAQISAPGIDVLYTWKFLGYANFQPFVSR